VRADLYGVAVAQEVGRLSGNMKGAGSIPGSPQAKCRGVPEQDTSLIAPDELAVATVDTGISV